MASKLTPMTMPIGWKHPRAALGAVSMNVWKECSLGDVIELKRGYDLPQQSRLRGTVPIVSSSGISDYHLEAMVKAPGVVTGRYGTLGHVFFVNEDFWPLNTTLYVKDFKGNDPRFVSYFLHSIDFLAYSDKAAVPGLNRNHLHEARVTVPTDVRVQRSIAYILGILDDKIELNRRTNETLEAMARALFKDWFIDFGPSCAKMEGRAPYLAADLWALFPDKLDEVGKPEGWQSTMLSDLVDVNPTEKLHKGAMAPYVDMASLPTTGSWSEPPVLREFGSGMKFRNSDTLLARITPCLENGKTAFVQNLPEGAVGWGSTEFIVMRPKGAVPAEFVYLLTRNTTFRECAIRSMTGTSGRQRAQASVIGSYPLLKVDDHVWLAFGELVAPLFQTIKANAEEAESLAKTRDLLLPKLLSGELRIEDTEKWLGNPV